MDGEMAVLAQTVLSSLGFALYDLTKLDYEAALRMVRQGSIALDALESILSARTREVKHAA